jgi:hypothetical protein
MNLFVIFATENQVNKLECLYVASLYNQ